MRSLRDGWCQQLQWYVLTLGLSPIASECQRTYHIPPGLMAGRFFLGFFEAMCLPLFSLITSQWYRRVEQPMRVATWFGTNGIASILGSLMAYGLSFIESDRLHNYQVMFLLTGGMTVVTGPAL